MGKVIIPPSRCQGGEVLHRFGKATELHLTDKDILLYWESIPVAVITGDVLYYHVPYPSAALTKVLSKLFDAHPGVSLASADFDFTVGSLLTRVGLSLTRAPQP